MFTLVIEDKNGAVADEYTFEDGEFLIGRSQSADIVLPSDNVSRRHARLYTVDGKCYIEDLGSANGVFVNGRRIHEVFPIEGSAQIKVGDYFLHIDSDTASAAAPVDRVLVKLHGQNLAFTDQVYRLEKATTLVGRGKDCGLTLIDPSISRIHAKLTFERGGRLTIEDLKSSNGSFINGERITTGTAGHRDTVRFGNADFIVEIPEAAPTSSPTARGRQASSADMAAWGAPPKKSRTGLWVGLSVFFVLVIGGGATWFFFGDKLFGKPQAEEAKSATVTPEDEKAQKEADKAKEEAELKAEEIQLLSDQGTAAVKGREWDKALTSWEGVLERDPLNETAQKAINQIKTWQKHQETLESARKLRKDKKYAEAAKALREIGEGSVYHAEAQEEIGLLVEMKGSLVMQADAMVKSRDCDGALKLYKEAVVLDPRDAVLVEKIKDVEKLPARKCK